MASEKTFKLLPELVPKPLWGISAYRLLGRGKAWKSIREAALQAADNRCSICGAVDPPLTCHESWQYDEEKGIALLIGFEIHCGACDSATHMGLSIKKGRGDSALRQLCRVNSINRAEAKKFFDKAMATWRRRNQRKWTVKVAEPLLKRTPQLQVLEGRKENHETRI